MKFLPRLLLMLAWMATNSCRSDVSEASADSTESSRCEISIQAGNVGLLARKAASGPLGVKFLLQLVSERGDTVRDSMMLTQGGSGYRALELASNRRWTLDVRGLDESDSLLYSGTKKFFLAPNQVQQISMAFDARYSTFRLSLPTQPGIVRWQAAMDGLAWMDQQVRPDSVGDSLSLILSHLAASPTGVSHRLVVHAFGVLLGQEREFYRADTVLMVESGRTDSFRLIMKWVGPGIPPDGRLTIQVEGRPIGNISVHVKYGDPTNPVREFFDSAAGVTYHYRRFANREWMLENIGSTCLGCDPRGTFFDSVTVQQACPVGWHVPDSLEWSDLFVLAGGPIHLMSSTGWKFVYQPYTPPLYQREEYNGDDGLGLHVTPTHLDTIYIYKGDALESRAHYWSSTAGCGIYFGSNIGEPLDLCANERSYRKNPEGSVVRCTRQYQGAGDE